MSIDGITFTNKKWIKTALITVGFVVIFLAVRNTMVLAVRYISLSEELRSAESSPRETKLKFSTKAFDDVNVNENIFSAISEAAVISGVTVKNIGVPTIFEIQGCRLLTEEITLEGDFIRILRCVDLADARLGMIKISSLKFEKEETYKSGALVLKVYFQMVTTDEDSKK
jgi:hypothetical protein